MNQQTYPVTGFSSRGSDFPCFAIAFYRKEDGGIYAAYPSGCVVKILDGPDPLADESKLLSRKNVWVPKTAQVICLDKREVVFAFSSDRIAIGDKSEVQNLIEEEGRLTSDTLIRDALETAAKSLT